MNPVTDETIGQALTTWWAVAHQTGNWDTVMDALSAMGDLIICTDLDAWEDLRDTKRLLWDIALEHHMVG
jgi:hypothetical protein